MNSIIAYTTSAYVMMLCAHTQGNIFINGQPIDQVRDWYTANTGYVLQLATPYYDELTVRENITLAALIKLPETFTTRDTFTRIEQVLAVVSFLKKSNA